MTKTIVRALHSLVLSTVLVLGLGPATVTAATTEAGWSGLEIPNALSRKAQLVTELLSQYHYRDLKLNNEVAATALDAYIEALDRDRYYFLQSDIDEFRRFANQLDDDLLKGHLEGAFRIFKRYEQRVRERAEYAMSILDKPLEFDADARLELDRHEQPWAKDVEELDELWRKRVKHDALTLEFSEQPKEKVREILGKRYQRLAKTVADYSDEDIFQSYINAWAMIFDPHTAYMSPQLSENFDIHMRLSLEGIGAMLKSENDIIEVVELVPGGPAQRSGEIKPGDQILGVGQGGNGDIVDVVGWRLTDVVEKIRGPKKTTVRLQILPKSAGIDSKPRVVAIERDEVKLEDQAAQAKTIEVEQSGQDYRIGVITLPAFYIDFAAAESGAKDYRSTTRDVRRLIDQLEEEGIDGLVIDLRGNGGGSLREASELTGLFIDTGPIVQVRRQDGHVEVLEDTDPSVAYEGPLAVMVDRFSASASEIFAAAIQDYGRGIVVGEQTFGKGTVQTLVDLERFSLSPSAPGGRLKLTIAKFYRINGDSTQRHGVMPDIELPSMLLSDEIGEASQKTALAWDEITPARYRPQGELKELLPVLRQKHKERVAENKAYQALLEEFRQIRALQERTSVPLHGETRRREREMAEKAQLDALNARLAAYDLPPVEALDELDEDSIPDTLLESTAAMVADLSVLRSTSMAARWESREAVAAD